MLGCLVEKARTTPDQYPLSLNALVTACNQTTNRWPVVRYDEGTVEAALDELRGRGADPAGEAARRPGHQVLGAAGAGARARRRRDRRARGPAAARPADARASSRPAPSGSTRSPTSAAVDDALQALATHEDGPFVVQLRPGAGAQGVAVARPAPGARRLGATTPTPATARPGGRCGRGHAGGPDGDLAARVAALEAEVAALRAATRRARERLAAVTSAAVPELEIFHNPSCSKSRGAMEILAERGVDADVTEYLKAPPTRAELERIVDVIAEPPAELVRKDKRFKELGLDAADYETRDAGRRAARRAPRAHGTSRRDRRGPRRHRPAAREAPRAPLNRKAAPAMATTLTAESVRDEVRAWLADELGPGPHRRRVVGPAHRVRATRRRRSPRTRSAGATTARSPTS